MGRVGLTAFLGVCIIFASISGAVARGPWMNLGGTAAAPKAFRGFCRQNPAECSRKNPKAGKLQMTPDRWGQLKSINRAVNRAVLASITSAIFSGVRSFIDLTPYVPLT